MASSSASPRQALPPVVEVLMIKPDRHVWWLVHGRWFVILSAAKPLKFHNCKHADHEDRRIKQAVHAGFSKACSAAAVGISSSLDITLQRIIILYEYVYTDMYTIYIRYIYVYMDIYTYNYKLHTTTVAGYN